jgi:hypothetical protein
MLLLLLPVILSTWVYAEGHDPVTQCEWIQDGGFELGHPNPQWTETTDGLQVLTPSVLFAHSGTWLATFGGQAFQPLNQSLQQTLTLPLGRLELSYYLEIPENSTDETDLLRIVVDGIELKRYTTAEGPLFRNYSLVSLDLSRFGDGNQHTLRFECHVSGEPVTTFRVDDVTIQSCLSPAPVDLFLFSRYWREPQYGVEDLIETITGMKD